MKARTHFQSNSSKLFDFKQQLVALTPKTRQEIASEYGISRKTLSRWLKNKQIILSTGLVKRKDLELIYQTFGWPDISKK